MPKANANPKAAEYPADVVAAGASVAALFDECIANGCTPRFAEMLALQQAPKSQTDVEFFKGHGTLADQFKGDEQGLQFRIQRARNRGYNPGRNDFYNPALARFAGDPRAFIPASGGKGQARRVVADETDAQLRAREKSKRAGGKRLAKDIVERKVREMVKADPALKLKDQRELREAVIEKHGSKAAT